MMMNRFDVGVQQRNSPLLSANNDGFEKSPSAALRFTFVAAAYPPCTPHSSGFARLASGAFYFAILWMNYYEAINNKHILKTIQGGLKNNGHHSRSSLIFGRKFEILNIQGYFS